MIDKETIIILCATDNKYAPYCGIMLTSLFESNSDCHFCVFVLTDGSLSEKNVKRYSHLGKKYNNEIVLKTVDESILNGFPIVSGRLPLSTYYRLLAAELLPEEVHKVLYFDSDIIVRGDIKPLWKVDLDGIAVAGANAIVSWDNFIGCCKLNRLEYDLCDGYFNAGVLAINLDYWREQCVSDSLLNYIRSNLGNKEKLRYLDQDALNAILHDKNSFFSENYNFQVSIFNKKYWGVYPQNQQQFYLRKCGSVTVIHYIGVKPWNYRDYGGPFFPDWEKYRRKSLWKDCRDTTPWVKYIKHMIKRYLFPGVFRRQYPDWVVVPENKKCY